MLTSVSSISSRTTAADVILQVKNAATTAPVLCPMLDANFVKNVSVTIVSHFSSDSGDNLHTI